MILTRQQTDPSKKIDLELYHELYGILERVTILNTVSDC